MKTSDAELVIRKAADAKVKMLKRQLNRAKVNCPVCEGKDKLQLWLDLKPWRKDRHRMQIKCDTEGCIMMFLD